MPYIKFHCLRCIKLLKLTKERNHITLLIYYELQATDVRLNSKLAQ